MLLFKDSNPVTTLLKLLADVNPEHAARLSEETVAVGAPKAIDPAENNGYNTEVAIRAIGSLAALGTVKLRYNRIDLTKIYPGQAVQLEVEVDQTYQFFYNRDTEALSNVFGTQFSDDKSEHPDLIFSYSTLNSSGAWAKGTMITGATSLRYVPNKYIYLQIRTTGIGLAKIVKTYGLNPYVDPEDSPVYTFNASALQNKFDPASGKRSYWHTVAALDFSEVFGPGPDTAVIMENASKGRFTDDAFAKINALLSTANLPPLPSPEFNSRSAGGYSSASYSPFNKDRNQHFRIPYTSLSYNYLDVANLHAENDQLVNNLVFTYNLL